MGWCRYQNLMVMLFRQAAKVDTQNMSVGKNKGQVLNPIDNELHRNGGKEQPHYAAKNPQKNRVDPSGAVNRNTQYYIASEIHQRHTAHKCNIVADAYCLRLQDNNR